MNKKTIIFYCCMVFVLIIYLFKANDIVLLFDKDDKIERMSFDEIESNTEVYMYLDKFENLGGILEKVYFQAWAFCETLYDNSDKKVALVFKNSDSDDCYMVESVPQFRADVYAAYKESKNMNSMTGIECRFSTLKIKDGTYDLYIYVRENDYNYGLHDTQTRYVKNSSGLTKIVE